MALKIFILFMLAGCQPARAEERIIVFMPSHAEILAALGAKNVIGMSSFSDPALLPGAEKVGDLVNPNMEKIAALKPTAVILGQWQNSAAAHRINALGIRVEEIPPEQTVEDIFATINALARASGTTAQAAKLIDAMKSQLRRLAEKVKARSRRPKVYIELAPKHWTAGGGSFISDMVEQAGGENAFKAMRAPYAPVSWEAVVNADPDIIISLSGAAAELAALPGAQKIKAVRDNAVIADIDRDAFLRPTQKTPEIIQTLYDRFRKY